MLKTKVASRPAKTRPSRRAVRSLTRRTTWTLPRDILENVERFARERRQTVSSAAAYLLQEALRAQPQPRKGPEGDFLDMLRKSFGGLTEREQMLVDGIIMDDPGPGAK